MQRAKQFNDIDGVSPMFSMKWLTDIRTCPTCPA